MTTIVLVFAVPLLLASAMIDPAGLHLALPFLGWGSFLIVFAFPPAGESRPRSVLAFWLEGSVIATAVISFIAAAMSYPIPGTRIDLTGHLLIPFAPRAGIAIGLFGLCMLVSCGVVGAIAPVLRREVAIHAALIGGTVLFGIVYAAGCALVAG
jgi:hypothetical protein